MDFLFGENLTVDTVDQVPEHFRPFYAQGQDGKFALNESFKPTALAVDGLNKSLKAARKDAETFKGKIPDMAPWTALGQLVGVDGDVTPEMLGEKIKEVIQQSKDGKVNWDKLKKDLEDAHGRKLTEKDKEVEQAHATVRRYLVTSEATAAIAAEKGVPELLLPHIERMTKVIKEGDNFVARVVDDQGDPRGDGKGGFMTIKDLVKELKGHATFGRAFESETPSGGGARPGSGERKGPGQVQQRSSIDKIAAGLRRR